MYSKKIVRNERDPEMILTLVPNENFNWLINFSTKLDRFNPWIEETFYDLQFFTESQNSYWFECFDFFILNKENVN